MDSLKSKVAVVTGAASGIGLAFCERFLAEGMQVVLADIEEEALAKQVARLAEAGGAVLGVRCDVRESADIEALADRAASEFGGTQVLCNNAGVGPAGPMLDTKPADWRWTFDVNVLGVAYGVTTFVPRMLEAGEGHVVNTASEAGLATNPALGMYCASKHAVVGLSEALYFELEGTPVGVSCLCPNLVKTQIFESERNRDDGAALLDSQVATLAPLREAMAAVGISAEKVAGDVVDAIRADRFWVLPHDTSVQVASKRFADLENGSNPTDPYTDVDLGVEFES
jgi:NAD(P)-dependent dehydrogenase (short-subunit alcohol dehydrogenase family)